MLLENPLPTYFSPMIAKALPGIAPMQLAMSAIGLGFVAVGLLAYFIGSIPFGLLLTKAAGQGDIRTIGSGNIGATNVLRTGKKSLAAMTLLLDMAKGWFAVWLAAGLGIGYIVPALFVVLGHLFPVWLRFRGGKGVATAIGAFFAVTLYLGLGVIAAWLAVFVITRISSLSALIAFALAPLLAYMLLPKLGGIYLDIYGILFVAMVALIVIARHHANIRRLLRGEEPKFVRHA